MPSLPEDMQDTIVSLSYTSLTNMANLLDDRLHIVLCQRIVKRTRTQDESVMQDRSIHKRFAASLYLLHDPLVQDIKPFLIATQ